MPPQYDRFCNLLHTTVWQCVKLQRLSLRLTFDVPIAVVYSPQVGLNAGHCVHDEVPEVVNMELLKWVESLP
eukprot:39581-Eustigmatos_ZCMA.PRE.1